jgi:hypothetical protein
LLLTRKSIHDLYEKIAQTSLKKEREVVAILEEGIVKDYVIDRFKLEAEETLLKVKRRQQILGYNYKTF